MFVLLWVAASGFVGTATGDAPPSLGPAGQAVAGPGTVLHPDSAPADDPFPISRVRAAEADLPELQKQLLSGALVRLPRSEFEGRVRAAGRVAAKERQVPLIAEARYAASLTDDDLVGTAELDVVNPASAARWMPLEPMRVASGAVTWGDGREAVFGMPAGGAAPGVRVDRPDRGTLKFEWSVAGTTGPGERRFELRVPPAPTAVLDLELPAGQVPSAPTSEVLVTGPSPARSSSRSSWRFQFGGQSRLDLAIRLARTPGALASANLAARYELAPGQLTAGFEYDLTPAKGAVGEWAFEVDPGLRVTDVVVNNRARWAIDPAAGPDKPRRLRVLLRQPGAGGKLLISAIAPLLDAARSAAAPLPCVRPVGATVDEDALEVRVAPALTIDDWNPGNYRLADSQFLADQTRVLTFVGTPRAAADDRDFRRLPWIGTSFAAAEFATAEQTEWRLGPDGTSATVRVNVRVRRGPVFGLSLAVPPGYSLTRLASTPDDLLSYSGLTAGTATADFARSLTAGQAVDLLFEFRGPRLGPGPVPLSFPGFTPIGATERTGVLGVFAAGGWAVESQGGVGTDRVGWFDPAAPPGLPGAAACFRYRGGNPDGRVTLVRTRPRFTVESSAATAPLRGGALETTTFLVRVEQGELPSFISYEPDGGAASRTWRVVGTGNAVTAASQVPVGALLRTVVPGAQRVGSLWVVGLARPAGGEVTVETAATFPPGGRPEAAAPVPVGAAAYSARTPPGAGPPPPESQPKWGFSGLYLVNAVRSEADVSAIFGGLVTSSAGRLLPLRVPPGSVIRAAMIDDRSVEAGALRVSDAGVVNLPLPGAGPTRFELHYSLAASRTGPVTLVRSPEPQLPGGGGDVRRWWVFSPDVLPGWPAPSWDRGTTADLPPTLAALPFSGPGVLVSRSPAADVRVAPKRLADAAGLVLAAIVFLLCWSGGRRRHPFCGLLAVAALLAAGVAGQLAPPWWQRVAGVPLLVGLVAGAAMVVARGCRSRAAVVAGLAIVLLVRESESAAQPVAPATVAILPPGTDGREMVVAPKAVLDRLAASARLAAPAAVLTRAEYSAAVDDTTARVVAKFVAHSFPDTDQTVLLPLADARLERVTVNGTAAFPTAPRPGRYAVPLPHAGRHEIEVRFSVAITGTGPERDFRFGVPEVPSSKLAAVLPAMARQAQAAGRLGRQSLAEGKQVHLEVDIGGAKVVHVRWRDGAGGAATVKVREGCVWDVTESGAKLTACYLTKIEQGTVSSLRFDTPSELDPVAVAVRPLDPAGAASLRDWTLGDGQAGFRQLKLDFQAPTAGRVLVVLTLVPRAAMTRAPVLRFPRVVAPGVPPADPDAAYALRTSGVTIENFSSGGVIDFSSETFSRDFSSVAELRLDPNAPGRVFRPVGTGPADLRPTLRVAVDPPAYTLDTTWHVAPHRADATGTVRWAGKDAVAVLELTLPGVKVFEVRGADATTSAAPGNRLLVWLKKPAKEGEVTWSGSATAPASQFEARTPQVAHGRAVTDVVRVRPAEGFALRVDHDRAWTALAPTGDTIVLRSSTLASPPVRVTVMPTPPTAFVSEFGWLTGPQRPPTKPAAAASPAVQPEPRPRPASAAPQPEEPVQWVWPVSMAAVWCIAAGILAVLLVRFPHATWPEQLGVFGGLFGVAVAGGWWAGLVAWVLARVASWVLPSRHR